MLHFVFLKRIANIYPATSEIITQLLERIEKSLPDSEQKSLRQLADELNTRILFMGTPPDFEEDASEKIRIILQAIHDHRKIEVTYRDSGDTERQSIRIPLMIIIYEDELYVGCQRMDGNTYTLKFRRIKKVKLSKEMFAEDPKVVDKLRRQVTSGAAFMSGQEPKLQDIEIEFQGHARLYLEENPFNRSMQIGKTKDVMFTVKLKAEVNQMLFNWVVSFSDVARVIKPVSLRKWLKEYAEYLMENYGG
jgi:predicted DNA-binding transcriptional regulator YafY